ncbi:MAG: diadenylate cyclase CdaA [Geitlerinemataceae cyanobacterium]
MALAQLLLTQAWPQVLVARLGQHLGAAIDFALVLGLLYAFTVVVSERRTVWMVQGLAVCVLASALSRAFDLLLLHLVLDKVAIVAAVSFAIALQSETRQFLEQLGRGDLRSLFQSASPRREQSNSTIDEIVEAVRKLSQNRTGALLLLETDRPIDERDLSVLGVKLNAEVSSELLQTIFQTSTPLHDGAVWIRDSRVLSAGSILPLSERTASRQLGTRHRAAMGITERVPQSLCIVVSEETGSISIAERGCLDRPLTSAKLREILDTRFTVNAESEVKTPGLRKLGKKLAFGGLSTLSGLWRSSPRPDKNEPRP